jgi:hypothetical protein
MYIFSNAVGKLAQDLGKNKALLSLDLSKNGYETNTPRLH